MWSKQASTPENSQTPSKNFQKIINPTEIIEKISIVTPVRSKALSESTVARDSCSI